MAGNHRFECSHFEGLDGRWAVTLWDDTDRRSGRGTGNGVTFIHCRTKEGAMTTTKFLNYCMGASEKAELWKANQ